MVLSLLYKFTLFASDEGPTLETLDYTIYIGSIPTFLYFDLYLYVAHYVYFYFRVICILRSTLRLFLF